MLTVFLRDVENETFLFFVEHKTYHSVYDALTNDLESFFDKHFAVYASVSPKSFVVYFRSPEVKCGYYDVTLTVGERKIRREYIGAPEWNTEETLPYQYDMSALNRIDEGEFAAQKMIVLLGGITAPGVNRVAELVRKDFQKKDKAQPEK
jgi:hypothetical protein